MKKTAALLLTVIIMMMTILPLTASAVVVSLENGMAFNPGNTRWSNPDYNYAWLDNLFVRDGQMSFTLKEMKPTPKDYPYSHTYEDFIEESERFVDLYELDEETVGDLYSQITDAVYYAVVAMGMTSDTDTMRDYLRDYGISLPEEETAEDKAVIAIVYAAIKYDAVYVIYDQELTIPKGMSLNAALVTILGKLTGTMVPSGVDTVTGLAVQAAKDYVTEFEDIPLSQNPDSSEIFHWLKVLLSATNGFDIPMVAYDKATDAQKEYVNYAYRSTVLETGYEVQVNPVMLMVANNSSEENAVQRLILTTMLDDKGVSYSNGATTEELFNLACENGYFALDNEFYSDVLSYEIEVAPSCESLWFTPITLGDQLNGGDASPLTLELQDQPLAAGSTTSVKLDTTKEEEKVTLAVYYDDARARNDFAVYEFTVIKNPALETEEGKSTGNDMLDQLQGFINSVVPSDSEKASEILDGVFSAIGSVGSELTTGEFNLDILTTYGTGGSSGGVAGEAETDRFELDYLEELVGDLYATDADGNIITTSVYTASEKTDDAQEKSIVTRAAETIKENPEIVAAPTSLIALGGLVGYLMNKKHRDSEIFANEDNGEDNEDNDE